MPLREITHPAIDVDLRYATPDNFTGKTIYDHAVAYLHLDALAALTRAAELAAAQGLRLRVLDAYRPSAAQWRLWAALPDPRFVADPRLGSMHTRGVAVDLTLCDENGEPLDMGTAFDAGPDDPGRLDPSSLRVVALQPARPHPLPAAQRRRRGQFFDGLKPFTVVQITPLAFGQA
jgi:hypothetical protein